MLLPQNSRFSDSKGKVGFRWAKTVSFYTSVSAPEPHLRQKISVFWVKNPSPTKETEHFPQLKHSLCHWRSWKQMNLAPLRPEKEL